jgi:lipopolysaccharide biosynthesis protein
MVAEADQVASLRCAAVLHFHTPTKARQFFADFGSHLVGKVDFFVTTSEALVASVLLSLAQDYGIAAMDVRVLPNIGRDLPSKYIIFNEELQAYDLCFFSHGKESDGQWFHDQNLMLAGSSTRVDAIKQMFADDPELGLIFPDYPSSLLWLIGWGSMRPIVDTLLAPMGCDTSSVEILEYPAGGFYWARPAALLILHSLGLTLDSMPPEPLPQDNSLLHALERMPCLSCEMMGFRWEKIARDDPSSYVSRPS